MSPKVVYKMVYSLLEKAHLKRTHVFTQVLDFTTNSGGRIRTSDLRVMGPTSYQTALPRDQCRFYGRSITMFVATGDRHISYLSKKRNHNTLAQVDQAKAADYAKLLRIFSPRLSSWPSPY